MKKPAYWRVLLWSFWLPVDYPKGRSDWLSTAELTHASTTGEEAKAGECCGWEWDDGEWPFEAAEDEVGVGGAVAGIEVADHDSGELLTDAEPEAGEVKGDLVDILDGWAERSAIEEGRDAGVCGVEVAAVEADFPAGAFGIDSCVGAGDFVENEGVAGGPADGEVDGEGHGKPVWAVGAGASERELVAWIAAGLDMCKFTDRVVVHTNCVIPFFAIECDRPVGTVVDCGSCELIEVEGVVADSDIGCDCAASACT